MQLTNIGLANKRLWSLSTWGSDEVTNQSPCNSSNTDYIE